ncbi:MAG: hypothetical protein AB1486_09860 [Planctomycetota bacterium]
MMRTPVTAVLALLACVLVAPRVMPNPAARGPQEGDSSAGAPIDVRLHPACGRPLLVKLSRKLAGSASIEALGLRQEESLSGVTEIEFIDELTRLEGAREEGTRAFLICETTRNGEVIDPPLAGVTVRCTREGAQELVDLVGPRWLPPWVLDEMRAQRPSLGLRITFPEAVTVGRSLKIDLASLAPLLVDSSGQFERAEAELILERCDVEKRTAVFRGRASFTHRDRMGEFGSGALGAGSFAGAGSRGGEPRAGGKGGGGQAEIEVLTSYEADCMIETRPAEGRVLRLTLQGEFSMAGEGRSPIRGEGTFEIDLRTAIGSAVDRARARRPPFRQNTVKLPEFGILFELPSCWAGVEPEERRYSFIRTLQEGAEGKAVVTVWVVVGEGQPLGEFCGKLLQETSASALELKESPVSAPLGLGKTFTFRKEADGEKRLFQLDVYPLGENYLHLQLEGPPRAFQNGAVDFARARRTLKLLK